MLKKHQIPFAAPDISEEEIDAVVECLQSGWLTTGSRCAKFERDFITFLGGGIEAISVSSGTAGLEIALAVHGIGPGDEIITTDFTFSATAMSAIHVGATPVLVDIDPKTLNIDCKKIECAISPRTKAIVPVHYAGLSCDLRAICEIAERHSLKVIEDAAHAFPTIHKGKMIGQGTSDATVFSFYATKTITTGEGGMITFKKRDIARKARTLRFHGLDRELFARYRDPGRSWRYDVVAPGFKSNLSDIAAALGIVQLKRAWNFHTRRAELWAAYDEGLAALPLLLPPKAPANDIHSYHLYAIRLLDDAPIGRDAFVADMASLGVNCGVHFIPLHGHTYWRERLNLSDHIFSESQKAFEKIVSLPLFTSMTEEMQQHVINSIKQLLT